MRSLACEFSYVTSCTTGSCPISEKWIFTAFLMSTSTNVAPRHSISFTALSYVRSVVPNPGMVTAMIPLRSLPDKSNARTVTRSARVESSPPEIPTTALAFVCSKRFFNPIAWIIRISSHRLSLVFLSPGTNGAGSTKRVSFVSSIFNENAMSVCVSSVSNVVILRRSSVSFSTSISE